MATKLVLDFKSILSEKEKAVIQKRIDENYAGESNIIKDEEYLTSFSDAIGKGELKWSDNLTETFMRLAKPLLNIFRGKGYGKLEFESGRDVYNFIKDYQKNIKKGKISERAELVMATGENAPTPTTDKKSLTTPDVTPRGAELIQLNKEGLITNEGLVEIINSPSSKPVDKFGAIDAVVESNWPVISNSIKFNPTGSIPIEAVKTAVTEQIQGIFPGRKKELFKDFDLSRDNKVTTILGPKFLGMRQAEILERAKQIGGTTSEGTSTDSAQAKQIVDTSTTPSKSYVEIVEDRSSSTLITIFNKVVRPGSVIHTDEWASYGQLRHNTSFLHRMICHRYHFVVPRTGVHT